jgi:hypothetical protein
MACNDCNQAETLANTIKAACEQLVKGHAGISALYSQLANQTTDTAVSQMFQEAAEKHRRLAIETAANITLPEKSDVPQAAQSSAA